MKKDVLITETLLIMLQPKIQKWYENNLTSQPQQETINTLIKAINKNELSIKEALHLAFIVGKQWDIKFEGVP